MNEEVNSREVLRLMSPHTRANNTRARWENVLTMWEQGKTLKQIGQWIGRSASMARQLIKRAAIERQKQPGFRWPQKYGRNICDIPYPMPLACRDPWNWEHVRGTLVGRRQDVIYCPVCKQTIIPPCTLAQDFCSKERQCN